MNGTLIDATGAPPRPGSTVLIEGNKIVKVGPASEVAVPEDAQVIDARGMTIMPGLINSNEHVQLNPLYRPPRPICRAASCANAGRAISNQMRRKAFVFLMQGVTSQRQTSGPWKRLLPIKKEIDAGSTPGPRIFLGGALIMSPQFFKHYTEVNRTPAEALDWLHNDFAYFVVGDPKDLDKLEGADLRIGNSI